MYNTVVVAVDLVEHTDTLINKALQFANSNNATIHLLHVLEDPATLCDAYAIAASPSFDTASLCEQLQDKLNTVAAKFTIDSTQCHIDIGPVSQCIVDKAEALNADLIIAGSHGRHGLALMLMGSTCDSVLHHAKTDFLAINIHK
jgi:universal stress protein A